MTSMVCRDVTCDDLCVVRSMSCGVVSGGDGGGGCVLW